MASDVQLVCFDLGRVLIRICDTWAHACEVAGLPVLEKLSPETRPPFDHLIAQFDSGQIDLDRFAQGVAVLRKVPASAVIKMHEVYLRGPYPGAFELVDELIAKGVTTACLSNTTDLHWQQMHDPAGPNFMDLERLRYRFASFQMGCRKPDEPIYHTVERAVGLSGPQIIFFDDHEPNIATALKCGWRAYVIKQDGEPIRQVREHLRSLAIL